MDTHRQAPELTVYYDGNCPLCSLEIDHYKRQSGAEALCFVDASSLTADLGGDLGRDTALSRFHVRNAKGELLSGARGFVAIWSVLPRWRWAAGFARWPAVTPLLELAYRGFLPLRPWLARILARRRP
ncbi:thiol-disulfide oxidoreductase DCC family protein [Lentibacter sp.]|uniref:thiol-disulfide oxidoreductase DCC family protein n=1 Tax=Lentibacter sp. TaxID=2024994 RepID=UPI003F69AF37